VNERGNGNTGTIRTGGADVGAGASGVEAATRTEMWNSILVGNKLAC
jgi:hypothetical protein